MKLSSTFDTDRNYRLQEICYARKWLEDEWDKRAVLSVRYKREVNVMDGTDTLLVSSSVAIYVTGACLQLL